MFFTNTILLIVLIINTFFLYILIQKKDNELIKVFRYVNIGIIIWTLPVFLWPFIYDERILYVLGVVAYWGPLLVSYSVLRVAYMFPVSKNLISKKLKILFAFVFWLGIIITLIPDFVLIGVGAQGYDLITGVGIYLFFSIIILFALSSLIIFILKYPKADGFYKYQLKYLLFGFFASITIGFISNALLALFNTYSFVWVGPSVTLFFIGFVTYTITRYRFMGINVIASKIYLYAILALFAYTFFYATYLFETYFLDGIFSLKSLFFGFFIALVFAYIFLKLLNYTQKTSDIIFFRGYNPRRILKDIILKITTVINLKELIDILSKEFKKIIQTEEMDILLLSSDKKDKKSCSTGLRQFKKFKFCIDGPIFQRIAKNNKIIIRDEMDGDDQEIVNALDKHKIKVVAPIISRYRLIGVIILGKKMNQKAYTQEDVEFLEIMISQAATAIENARLYKEVDDFSRDLKKRVDEQTADIRKKTERLQKLLAMRSEFLDIASHQLRTPVSVIKGVLSMMKEGSVPDDRKQEFIESALSKSFKLEEVIDEILRASEMDSDNFEIDLGPLDILSILNSVYEDKKVLASDKGVKFVLNLPKKIPEVLSNEKYIKHVIRNIVNNSIQYTTKGSITLSAIKKRGYLEIHVKDTGIGIPKKDIPSLFKKFSRAKNAVDVYTDGSGLGLFIMKKIIDAHPGGKVYIKDTKINKGTTMVLKLPFAK